MVVTSISTKTRAKLSQHQMNERRSQIASTWSDQERRQRAARAKTRIELLWTLLQRPF